MADQYLRERPEWFTEKMAGDGWEVLEPDMIGRVLDLGNNPGMALAISKNHRGWGYSCGNGRCGLKVSLPGWSVDIFNADGSPIFFSEFKITAELMREYVVGGNRYSIKRKGVHDGMPVAAYGVWFDAGSEGKDIKLSYAIISGDNDNPVIRASGEIEFCQ